MSLHIKIPKDKKSLVSKIKVVLRFFNYFKENINPLNFNIKHQGGMVLKKNFDLNISCDEIIGDVKDEKMASIEFFFKINNYLAVIEINNEYHSKFAEDVELILFNIDFSSFLSSQDIRDKLDLFLKKLYDERLLVKAYVDLNEEGEDNPLDIIYEYEPRGANFFISVIRALEILSEDSSDLIPLYDKIRSSDKNFVANRLWSNPKIRGMIFSMAREKGIIIQEGSVLIFAKNDGEIKDYYREIIDTILNPIFNKMPSVAEEIEKFSENLDTEKFLL